MVPEFFHLCNMDNFGHSFIQVFHGADVVRVDRNDFEHLILVFWFNGEGVLDSVQTESHTALVVNLKHSGNYFEPCRIYCEAFHLLEAEKCQ